MEYNVQNATGTFDIKLLNIQFWYKLNHLIAHGLNIFVSVFSLSRYIYIYIYRERERERERESERDRER